MYVICYRVCSIQCSFRRIAIERRWVEYQINKVQCTFLFESLSFSNEYAKWLRDTRCLFIQCKNSNTRAHLYIIVMNEWINEWMNECMDECRYEWMYNKINELFKNE